MDSEKKEPNFEIARLLLDKNSHIAVGDDSGNTPLHLASQCGFLEFFKHCENVKVTNNLKETPLHIGIFKIIMFTAEMSNHNHNCRKL